MIKKVIISDVLETFINSIDFTQTVLSHSDDGTDTTITVDDVYHSFVRGTVKVDGTDYIIKSVNYKTNTVVLVGVIADPLIYDVGTPFFIHGVSRMVTTRINHLIDTNRTPFIYLLDGGSFSYNNTLGATYGITENITLFFVADNSFSNLDNTSEADYHIDDVISPLKGLFAKFSAELLNYKLFGVKDLEKDIKGKELIGFGDVYKGRGANPIDSVFDANLDALGLSVDLPINTDLNCSN